MKSVLVAQEDLFHACLLASGGCQQSLAFLGLLMHHSSVYFHPPKAFPPPPTLCLCVFSLSSLGLGPSLFLHDLILIPLIIPPKILIPDKVIF